MDEESMRFRTRIVSVVAVSIAAVLTTLLAASPAQAYTSSYFAKLCYASDGNRAMYLEGDWYRSNDKTTVTLANAYIDQAGPYRWDITASRWEDLTTGAVVRGITGFLPLNGRLGPWSPNTWFPAGHGVRWRVTAYDDRNSGITATCVVTP